MQYTTDFEAQYTDRLRQMAWVNEEGWTFDPPVARTPIRLTPPMEQATIPVAPCPKTSHA